MNTERPIFHGRMGGSVFVDALQPRHEIEGWSQPAACRLFTLPGWLEDLHDFAEQIGLLRMWFQDHAAMPHYVLTRARRKAAVALGAVEVSRGDTAGAIRSWRDSNRRSEAEALKEQLRIEFSNPWLGEPFRERRKRFLTEAEVLAGFAECRRALGGSK